MPRTNKKYIVKIIPIVNDGRYFEFKVLLGEWKKKQSIIEMDSNVFHIWFTNIRNSIIGDHIKEIHPITNALGKVLIYDFLSKIGGNYYFVYYCEIKE